MQCASHTHTAPDIVPLHASDEELKRFSAKLDAHIRRKRLSGEEVAEIKAIVMMTSRSMERRLKAGSMNPSNIREELDDALYAQIVEREGLISAEDWGELTDQESSSSHTDAAPQPPKATSIADIVNQLKDMFPQAPPGLLLAAAQSSTSLDEAVAKLTAPVPATSERFCRCVRSECVHA
jgi:hypothetical protein